MSARILPFPARGPFAVRIERQRDMPGWLVVARWHAWLHSARQDAELEAAELARGFGVAVHATEETPE